MLNVNLFEIMLRRITERTPLEQVRMSRMGNAGGVRARKNAWKEKFRIIFLSGLTVLCLIRKRLTRNICELFVDIAFLSGLCSVFSDFFKKN